MSRALLFFAFLFAASSLEALPQDDSKGMGPVDFLSIDRLSEPVPSPDGRHLIYLRSSVQWSKNDRTSRYRLIDLATGDVLPTPKPIKSTKGVSDVWWHPDGSGFIYLRAPENSRKRQAYFFNIETKASEKLTEHEESVRAILWAPDGAGFYFSTDKHEEPMQDGRRIKEEWRIKGYDTPSNREIWYFNLQTRQSEAIVSGDFSVRFASLSRDGNYLVYSRAPDQRLDSSYLREVFVRDLKTGDERVWTRNAFSENSPRLSPDNSAIAYIATVNEAGAPYYEDKVFIQKYGEKRRRLLSHMAFEALSYQWDQSGQGLFILGNTGLRTALYRYDLTTETLTALTHGDQVVSDWHYNPITDMHTARITNADSPGELYVKRSTSTQFEPLTEEYETWDDEYLLPQQEAVMWTARDGTALEGLLVYPVGYEQGSRAPLVTITHGGPRSSSQFGTWNSSRYVPVLAAQGYMVFLPNHRGGTGYGDAFMRDMYGAYFRNAHTDVMDGIDALIARGHADPNRLIKMGWSAGGHMVNKLITETDRFAAASSGAGASDWVSMHGESDVRRTRSFVFGGSPWEEDAPSQQYLADSPLNDAWKVTTPTLFFVGEDDVRVPPTQSILMFRGVQATGTETHLYQAPDEPHNFRKPAHQLFKINAELAWYARFALKEDYEFDLPESAYKDSNEDEGWTLDLVEE